MTATESLASEQVCFGKERINNEETSRGNLGKGQKIAPGGGGGGGMGRERRRVDQPTDRPTDRPRPVHRLQKAKCP